MDEPSSPATAPEFDATAMPPMDELLDALTSPLADWMPNQRWFAHMGAGTPEVSIRGWAPLRVAPDHVVVLVVVGARFAGTEPAEALYQVPLLIRPEDSPAADRRTTDQDEGSEVSVLETPAARVRVHDALRDVDGRAAVFALLASDEQAQGPGMSVLAHRTAPGSPLPLGPGLRSRILSGEQSNTSIIVEPEGTSPIILKLFRVLHDGENPDVVLQGALTAAGSTRVPRLIGSASLELGDLRTHSLFAQEFLPGVEDAWRTALRLAVAGEDFSAAARGLGEAVSEVHRDLAGALGTTMTDDALRAGMVEQMRSRAAMVAAEVPQVAAHRTALDALLDAALDVPWPPMQRIHGDLHLGQVLLVPDRGWVLLDFEGEPLRPLAQRSLPDSPLRDVAGMLRSLDYVGGAVALEQGADASSWVRAARAAFLEGCMGAADGSTGTAAAEGDAHADPNANATADTHALGVLLAAFEADKAVYEALYESRNRPDWLPIPLAALERISARNA
ncbi:maltokinase N-terminal cap-like domain-containing protein [Brachybacterium tyrofermentans]|uniref:maltokinase N-terminal cap-like domain-containing protein n=1 Tax=Brachybacterium tyrofermentans TaxID=47848 RepID=UPI0018661653|nr:phosphotransferase [Brachybacterium tyrofermentans]